MFKVSIIVPIYRVEKFIEKCVHSLMKQTIQDVEFIFVDDASPDDSVALLEKTLKFYPDRIKQTKIIHHKKNQGLPAARNSGLAVATGEYIYHCDSDDFVEPDMLESMYNAAKKNNADFVWSDWYLSYQNTERYMKQPDFTTPMEALKGMLADEMKFNVWNKLVKREVYVKNDILFPSGYSMGEDMTMIRLIACSERVAYVSKAFYHYVKTNAEAMSLTLNERYLTDIRHNVNLTLRFLEERGYTNLQQDFAFFKLNIKLPFLISLDYNNYNLEKSKRVTLYSI